jgi:cytochrome bd-type quinol oxidase subunit 2
MLTSLVVLGIVLLIVIIYIVWPYRKNKDTMKEQ